MPPGPTRTHDFLAYKKAQEILDSYGYKRSTDTWEEYTFPDGTRTIMPSLAIQMMEKALGDAADLGAARGSRADLGDNIDHNRLAMSPVPEPERTAAARREMALNTAMDTLYSWIPDIQAMIRAGVTVGPFIPNPVYFTTNAFGGMLQTYMKTGAGGVTSSAFGNPRMTTAVAGRLWGDGRRSEDGPVLVTKDGRVYTADMLADLAVEHKLNTSFIKSETAVSLARDIRSRFPKGYQHMMRAPKRWQAWLTEFSTATDNFWRIGVFQNELKNGKSPDMAAQIAKDALYDYSHLTETEKSVGRNVFMFYAFTRRNAALFFDTMMTNPHRVLGQLRLARGLNEWFMGEDDEDWHVQVPEHMQGRFMGDLRRSVMDAHRNAAVIKVAPVAPMMDALGLVTDAWMFSTVGDEDAGRNMLGRLAPIPKMAIEMATGETLFGGRDIDGKAATRVPQWMVDLDPLVGNVFTHTFGIQAQHLMDPAQRDNADDPNAYYATNEKAWYLFQNMAFIPGAGRSGQTVTSIYKAFGLQDPSWGLTQSEEVGNMLGVRSVVVPNYDEANRRWLIEMQKRTSEQVRDTPAGFTQEYLE
jgi:hypothetical protein